MKRITAKQLGVILYDEFERDAWGMVDPYYFKNPLKSNEKLFSGDMAGLYEVLERAAARITKRFNRQAPKKKAKASGKGR